MFITLKACRANVDMTRKEFGDAIGVTDMTIQRWEKGQGEPPLSKLRAISELSGIPMQYIVVGDNPEILNRKPLEMEDVI